MIGFIVFVIILFISIIVYIISYKHWCKTHRRPLTEDEIKRLSHKRINKEIKRVNNLVGRFESGYKYEKNTSLHSTGYFYNCNIDSYEFPSYISSQLFGKKHEWIVIGIVKNGIVIGYWANKGNDRNSVSLSISIKNIVELCVKNNCTAVLDLHNHPNSNPNKYNCLIASNSDKKTSRIWSDELNNKGISLFSFVCERGNWLLYFKNLTNKLQVYPEFTKISYINKENNVSEEQNLKLHKELGLFHK